MQSSEPWSPARSTSHSLLQVLRQTAGRDLISVALPTTWKRWGGWGQLAWLLVWSLLALTVILSAWLVVLSLLWNFKLPPEQNAALIPHREKR